MSVTIFDFVLPSGSTVSVSSADGSIDRAWRSSQYYDPGMSLDVVDNKQVKGLNTYTIRVRRTSADVCRAPAASRACPAPAATLVTNPTTTKKEISTMFNVNALRSSFFAQVACVVISLIDQKVGIKAADGNIKTATFPKEGAPTLSDNPFSDLSAAIPAFAIRTPIADVKKEDIVLLAGQPVWVVEYKEGVLQVLRTDGSLSSLVIAENALFKDKAVMRVTNPFAGAAGGAMSSLLPLILMGGEGEALPESLGLMLALGGLGGKDGKPGDMMSNPLLMMTLLGKGGLGGGAGGIDFKTMMLMQAMGGGAKDGGINPLMLLALAK